MCGKFHPRPRRPRKTITLLLGTTMAGHIRMRRSVKAHTADPFASIAHGPIGRAAEDVKVFPSEPWTGIFFTYYALIRCQQWASIQTWKMYKSAFVHVAQRIDNDRFVEG